MDLKLNVKKGIEMRECCICEEEGKARMTLVEWGLTKRFCDTHYIEFLESIVADITINKTTESFEKYKKKIEPMIKEKLQTQTKKSSATRIKR